MSLAVLLKRYWYPLAAGALIVFAVALRLALILLGWPHSNSEEGTMGLEAMHILLRGEHPIYLYGQRYMGVGEAYAGALAFRIFGVSTVALRLSMIVLYTCFMAGVCWLASLLYSRRVALVSLAALALGTPFLVKIELLTDGGKAETMALGALLFALASWLALTEPAAAPAAAPADAPTSRRRRTLRAAGFVAWGVMAGFGLYTYTIIAPFVLTTGLLLWLTCRRELRGWALALPLAGLLVGLAPDILYTATTPLAQNPIAVFWSLHQSLNTSGMSGAALLLKQFDGALLFTLPTVTGLASIYPVQALPLYGPPSGATVAAILIGGAWSLGYLALLGVATARPLRALWPAWALRWTTWRTMRLRDDLKGGLRKAAGIQATQASATLPALAQAEAQSDARDEARDEARNLGRLLLALTAWLTIAAYLFSATAANNPNSGRYMIGLLVITPALLWPLLDPAPHGPTAREALRRNAWRLAALALLAVCLVVGALSLAQTFPNEVAAGGRDAQFTHDLLSRGITRFYADYWTCDLLTFETRERLTCAVINEYARPGLTRYRPYADAVQADPAAPYVLAHGSEIERTFLIQAAQSHQRYTVQSFDGHDVYTPIGA